MPLKHAENFIREIARNNDLRTSLYNFNNAAEIQTYLQSLGYEFKLFEFEESINYLKTIAPHEEQAIMLDELLLWWNMLMFDGTIVEEEKPSCSPKACASCSGC